MVYEMHSIPCRGVYTRIYLITERYAGKSLPCRGGVKIADFDGGVYGDRKNSSSESFVLAPQTPQSACSAASSPKGEPFVR